jgi:hypothetical protein
MPAATVQVRVVAVELAGEVTAGRRAGIPKRRTTR